MKNDGVVLIKLLMSFPNNSNSLTVFSTDLLILTIP